ncbi:hypothetical protein D932_01605 [Enterococcus casseliflavus 14-MB-W-14]|uniref:DUF5677 domain-containing protein n=1 Tax=Enterococcus casseliflavus TaxID=37734 RepID=UPI0003532AAB|nr:DUF5677 domain-containing protein [Enterococcus casseliflavus]EPH64122.1 hypothetical protein D932_01605 [Enterococcus casseliflavus 14-MB-W-14]
MYTKKELYKYKQVIKFLENDLSDDFSFSVVMEIIKSMFEKIESIEILFKHKQYDAGRVIIRPCLQMSANLMFMIEDKKDIKRRARAYNSWCVQNIEYKASSFISSSGPALQESLNYEYNSVLNQTFPDVEPSAFKTLLKIQRDSFFETNKKRAWYNILEVYDTEEQFINKYIPENGSFLYKIFSEYVHGNDVAFRLGSKDSSLESSLDSLAFHTIFFYLRKILNTMILFSPERQKYENI